ncbi:MAG: hypothetical protein AAGI03_00675 [Pseudomonadota bacterium]
MPKRPKQIEAHGPDCPCKRCDADRQERVRRADERSPDRLYEIDLTNAHLTPMSELMKPVSARMINRRCATSNSWADPAKSHHGNPQGSKKTFRPVVRDA